MADWKLSRHHETCTACGRAFEADEALYSLLSFDTEELRREDACRACFPARRERAGDRLIFWRARHRVGKKAVAVDFEALEGLFVALEGRAERELRELRYLLALLLMRKKRVRLAKTGKREDGEVMILRRPRRDEALEVYVFDLDPERAEHLRGKLRAIFEGADLQELLTAPSEPAPAAGETGASDASDAPDAPDAERLATTEDAPAPADAPAADDLVTDEPAAEEPVAEEPASTADAPTR